MSKVSFDISKNLDLYFRRRRNGSITLTFLSDDLPYDLTGQDFSFLSEFSVDVSINQNIITLTYDKATSAPRNSYFWELYHSTSGKTWLSGTAFFTEGLSAEVDTDQSIQININGDTVEININANDSNDVNGGTP